MNIFQACLLLPCASRFHLYNEQHVTRGHAGVSLSAQHIKIVDFVFMFVRSFSVVPEANTIETWSAELCLLL